MMFKPKMHQDVTTNDEVALTVAVSKQPVAIAIEADSPVFQLYTSGVITSINCGVNLDHGVLVVGYNNVPSIPYWIVKNSWGS